MFKRFLLLASMAVPYLAYSSGYFGTGGGSVSVGGVVGSGTAGSVLFVDPTDTLAQDNANFFWDNANNRLGIGNAIPAFPLDLTGSFRFSGVMMTSITTDAATTGALANLGLPATDILRLTNSSLVSIRRIAEGAPNQKLTLVNNTTNPITIKNETGSPTTEQIITGIGGDLVLPANGSIQLYYDDLIIEKWVAVGTSSGSIAIGSSVGGGTDKSVPFISPAGVLSQDNTGFNFDSATDVLTLGAGPTITSFSTAGVVHNSAAGVLSSTALTAAQVVYPGASSQLTGEGAFTYNATTNTLNAQNHTGTNFTGSGSGHISNPGVGIESEKFGAATAAAGDQATAIGNGASAAGVQSVAIGYNASATADGSFALGTISGAGAAGALAVGFDNSVTGVNSMGMGTGISVQGADSIAIGNGANNLSDRSIAIGPTANNTNEDEIAIGYQANTLGGEAVAIGNGATAGAFQSTAIGTDADATGGLCTAIGVGANCGSDHAFALGVGANAAYPQSIAIGTGATTLVADSFVLGSETYPISAAYMGQGQFSASPGDFILGVSGANGTDIGAGDFILVGGRSSGNATPGNVTIQASTPGASGATLQSLSNVAVFNNNGLQMKKQSIQLEPFTTGAGNTSEIRFMELTTNGTHYTAFKAPDALSATRTLTLPDGAGSSGQALTTNGSTTLSWTSVVANPMDSTGDLIYGGASGAATKLDNGSSGQLLMANGAAAPTWVDTITGAKTFSAAITASSGITFGGSTLSTFVQGTWSPSPASGTNITGMGATQAYYTRVGNMVTYQFRLSGSVTSGANTLTSFVFTPPVASTNNGDIFNGTTVAINGATRDYGNVEDNSSGDASSAFVQWKANASGSTNVQIWGSYAIQ